MMNQISYTPIGTIHSPFTDPEGMPIQPSGAQGIRGFILIHEDLVDGLKDLEGFSHIYLLYHLHLSDSYQLQVIPFLDDRDRGVFSTRAPKRPNPIGLSVVKLHRIVKNRLEIENLDIVDGTPLLDIKPYVPEMIDAEDSRIGWLSGHRKEISTRKSDKRFR
jgi:tRNA-Thr(GGU) m(6)t(6)A37 methyltransferase TsaA